MPEPGRMYYVKEETESVGQHRMVRAKGALGVDAICQVEFGAVWATLGDRQERVGGQWRQCVVIPQVGGGSGEVHVRLSPDPATAPPALG